MKHLKQSKIWFLSYAFTFFICIVTSFVVTGLAKYILMGQIEETMSIAFENSINTFERKIESQQIKMFTVLESENVVTLSNKYLHPDRGTQLELARKIMDTMNIQYANNEFTDDNIICFKELDMAIGVRDSMGKDQAYKQWFSDMYESFDEWNKDIFDIKNTIKFRPFTDSNGRAKFAVIQKRLLSIGAVPTVVALSIIDVERFFGEMYEDPLYKIFVLSDSKQICSSFEGNQYEEKAENGKTVRFDGEEYIQYGRETNLLYFIQLFNSGDYTRRLSAVSRIGVIINICVFILGIFLSAFFTRINYTPLRRVMARFKLDVADENEFVAIEKGIENILQDRKNISRKLNESDERLYETYNKMLLNASSAEDARLIAQNLSMSFKYKNFAVSSFRINDIGSVSRKSDTQKENIRIATFCIINVYRELLSENIVCDFCTQDNNCYCILNFSDASAIHNICQITEKVCEFLKENFEMKLVYFVSAIGSIGDIPDMKEQLGTLPCRKQQSHEPLVADRLQKGRTEIKREHEKQQFDDRNSAEQKQDDQTSHTNAVFDQHGGAQQASRQRRDDCSGAGNGRQALLPDGGLDRVHRRQNHILNQIEPQNNACGPFEQLIRPLLDQMTEITELVRLGNAVDDFHNHISLNKRNHNGFQCPLACLYKKKSNLINAYGRRAPTDHGNGDGKCRQEHIHKIEHLGKGFLRNGNHKKKRI